MELLKWEANIQETVMNDPMEQVVKGNISLTEKNGELDAEEKLLKWEKNIQDTIKLDLQEKIISLKVDVNQQKDVSLGKETVKPEDRRWYITAGTRLH